MNQHQHQHQHQHETDAAAMAELLDLDAEVLNAYLSEVTGWVRRLAGDPPPGQILDVGSGTGAGALALAERFAKAQVTALDVSPYLLDRLTAKAHARDVADRIHTVQADLDQDWPAVGTVDLVWASNSLHHMADPDRVLTDVFATIRPGGLMVVVELNSFPRFLPDDLGIGRPGLEARCHAALAHGVAGELPHLGSDWNAHLTKSGFVVEAERTFTIDLSSPLPASADRYAQASLRRIRSGLDDQLSDEDLDTLDSLVASDGPDSVLLRDDLTIRATRTAWVARRP